VMARLLGPLLLICGADGGSYPKRGMRMGLVAIDSGIEVAVGEDSEHYSDTRWSHGCAERVGWKFEDLDDTLLRDSEVAYT
jgi:hypothetical protein